MEGRASECQAGYASQLRDVEKVPPGPEQSPKCAREGADRSGSQLGRPPLPTCLRGSQQRLTMRLGGHRWQSQAWHTQRRAGTCEGGTTTSGTPHMTSMELQTD